MPRHHDSAMLPEMGQNPFYGWELLYDTVRNSVMKKADLVIAFTHFVLTKQFNMGAMSPDVNPQIKYMRKGSEKLPERWNRDNARYSVNYVYGAKRLLLTGNVQGRELTISLQDTHSGLTTSIVLVPEKFVACIKGNLSDVIPGADILKERLIKELIGPILMGAASNDDGSHAYMHSNSHSEHRDHSSYHRRHRTPDDSREVHSSRRESATHLPRTDSKLYISRHDPRRYPKLVLVERRPDKGAERVPEKEEIVSKSASEEYAHYNSSRRRRQ